MTLRNGKVPALRSLTTADALYTPDTEFDVDADGYYLISSPEELYGFAKLVNESAETTLVNTSTIKISTLNAKLTKNIRLNDTAASTYANTPAKYSWTPIGEYLGGNKVRYQGHFDGQGYNISGIYCKISASKDHGIGLFGAVWGDGRVENLKLTNSYFEAYNQTSNIDIGSIAGYNRGCIDKVYSDAIVKGTGSLVAGIAGRSEGSISESWFAGSVEAGGTSIGGIVGYTSGVTITNCLNTGTVTGTHADGYVGGIVGRVFSGTNQISNSLNAGQLSSKKTATTGTVIGHENGKVTLTNVYAVKDATYTKLIGTGAQETGSVSGTKERADIIGYGALHNLGELNADNLWVERSDDVPSLKRFIEIEEEQP